MRSQPVRFSALLLFLASAFGLAVLFPSDARAELIDIANTPGICVTDLPWDSQVTNITEGTTYYNQIRAELTCNPYTIEPTSTKDYDHVMPFEQLVSEQIPRVNQTTSYEYAHSNLGYEVSRSKYRYILPAQQQVLAYVSLDLFETPLPAGTRLTFDGFQAPFIGVYDSFDSAQSLNSPPYKGTADRVLVWYSNSRYANNAKLATYNEDLGFYEIPESARYVYVSFRLRWVTAPSGNDGTEVYLYYLNHIHMYWQVIGSDTVSTNNTIDQQTDTLIDTTGSDTVTSDVVGTGTQQIEGLSLWQSLKDIGEQLQQAITTTESDTKIIFPGINLMGFTMSSYEIDPLSVSPIPRDTIRGFLTFVFVCWYLAYMRNLIRNIFGLRWYNYDGEVYDVGSSYRNGSSDNNWGLVE